MSTYYKLTVPGNPGPDASYLIRCTSPQSFTELGARIETLWAWLKDFHDLDITRDCWTLERLRMEGNTPMLGDQSIDPSDIDWLTDYDNPDIGFLS